jgi:hypothetical protein
VAPTPDEVDPTDWEAHYAQLRLHSTRPVARCPRCDAAAIPDDDAAGLHRGATSRSDDRTEICSDCGRDEAIGRGPIPAERWPIGAGDDPHWGRNPMVKHQLRTAATSGC